MKIKNRTNVTRVFNKTRAVPGSVVDVPDGVANKWVSRYGFAFIVDEKEKKPRQKKLPLEERL